MKPKLIRLDMKAVSVNHAYPSNRNGRRFLSKEGKTFKEALAWAAKESGVELLEGNIGIDFTFGFSDKRRRDVDGYLKIVQDALTGICFVDDSQITELTAKKVMSISPFVEIIVYKIN